MDRPDRPAITGRRVRIAVIGAGGMANSVHYPSLAACPDVEIVGICDIDPARLAATGDRYGVAARYSDYRTMIAEVSPDGVYAIGQPHIMYDIWRWVLTHDLPLYIEKPMGLTWHQAQILADLAEGRGLITQVSHQRRTSPLLRKLHAACLERGPITHAVCEFFKCQPGAMTGPADHMMDDCTHAIDTVRWLCGGEVTAIESRCRRIGTPDINWICAMLEFDNGATGLVVNSWSSGRRIFRVQIHAPGIYTDAEVEGKGTLYADGDYTGVTYDAREVAGSSENYVYGGFSAKCREFVDSLRTGVEVTSSPFRDCVKTMEVAHKILAQAILRGQ